MTGFGHYGLRCWIIDVPWLDHWEVRLAATTGHGQVHAVGVEKGDIVWQDHETGAVVEPFLRLGPGEFEAFAKAIGERSQVNDETRAALKDTREIRDRLLTLVEKAFKP